jgi:predicted enzyme related to lactoylglutathione lyase
MGCPVVHWEIAGKSGKTLQEFYGKLFGWQIDANNPMNYGMTKTGGEGGINGGIAQLGEGRPPYVTFYVQVPDLQASLDKAAGMGGKTIMPPMAVPGGPSLAMFTDPEGNLIGLVQGGTM